MSQTTVLTPLSRQPLSSEKYGLVIRDPRSRIRKKPILHPLLGIKKAPDPGSQTSILVMRQSCAVFCKNLWIFNLRINYEIC
jgi:hypothetical protein